MIFVRTDGNLASNQLPKRIGDGCGLGLGLAVLDVERGGQSHLFWVLLGLVWQDTQDQWPLA